MEQEKIVLEDCDFVDEATISFYIPATTELVVKLDKMRGDLGYVDVVENSDVYYDFFTTINYSTREVHLYGTCNHGEHDDYKTYEIEIDEKKKQEILWETIKYFFEN